MDTLLFKALHTFVQFLNETQHVIEDHFLTPILTADRSDVGALEYYAGVVKLLVDTCADAILAMKGPIVLSDGEQSLDLSHVAHRCSDDERIVFWQHLLTLLAIGDSERKPEAKRVLASLKPAASSEEAFLRGAIDSIEKSLDGKQLDTDNKMEIFTTLMTNSAITGLISDVQTKFAQGELDLGKMLAASQKLLDENGQGVNIMDEIQKMAPLIQSGGLNLPIPPPGENAKNT